MKTVLTLEEAAQRIGFSRKTLQREINSGRYPDSFKVGKRSCTYSADVDAYIARIGTEEDAKAQAIAKEAAERVKFRRELEEFFRFRHLVVPQQPCGDDGKPLLRSFHPDDPNRLP